MFSMLCRRLHTALKVKVIGGCKDTVNNNGASNINDWEDAVAVDKGSTKARAD